MAAEEPQQQKQDPLGSDAEGTDSGRTIRPGPAGAMPGRWFPRRPGQGGRRPSARSVPSSSTAAAAAAASPPPHNRRSRRRDPRPGGQAERAQARGPSPSRAPGAGPGPPRPPPSPLGAGLPGPGPCRPILAFRPRPMSGPRNSSAFSRAARAREGIVLHRTAEHKGLGGRWGCCGRRGV